MSPKLAGLAPAWLDHAVRNGWSDVVRSILSSIWGCISAIATGATGATGATWSGALSTGKAAVRWLSLHTGIPALLVAAILVGYRVLKRSARFFLEVAAVTLALLAASELGWLRW